GSNKPDIAYYKLIIKDDGKSEFIGITSHYETRIAGRNASIAMNTSALGLYKNNNVHVMNHSLIVGDRYIPTNITPTNLAVVFDKSTTLQVIEENDAVFLDAVINGASGSLTFIGSLNSTYPGMIEQRPTSNIGSWNGPRHIYWGPNDLGYTFVRLRRTKDTSPKQQSIKHNDEDKISRKKYKNKRKEDNQRYDQFKNFVQDGLKKENEKLTQKPANSQNPFEQNKIEEEFKNILFIQSKTDYLTKDDSLKVVYLGEALQKHVDWKVKLHGHTQLSGGRNENQKLS